MAIHAFTYWTSGQFVELHTTSKNKRVRSLIGDLSHENKKNSLCWLMVSERMRDWSLISADELVITFTMSLLLLLGKLKSLS